MSDESSAEDSWQSPSELDNSTDDPTYVDPATAWARRNELQKKVRKENKAAKRATKQRKASKNVPKPTDAMGTSQARNITVRSSSGTDSPGQIGGAKSSGDVTESDIEHRLELVSGRRRRIAIRTTFLSELEPEPYAYGIAQLPDDFAWCEDAPGDRMDLFMPNDAPGTTFKGNETPIEIFMALHEPAFDLLLQSINETGAELVQTKKMKSFKKVSWSELLRFHSVLIFCQSAKISRWEMYWRKSSPVYQVFVAQQMTFRRFKQIKRCIRCYIPSEVASQRTNDPKSNNYDPLYKISPM